MIGSRYDSFKGLCRNGWRRIIGCAITEGLLARFDHVITLNSLHPQIHPTRQRPTALPDDVELLVGDVTDPNTWKSLLDRVKPEIIVHLAAETGTGQSLTEGCRHSHVNVTGTTTMLDALASVGHVPDQVILSSSRAVYGEGAWRASEDSPLVYPGQRAPRTTGAGGIGFSGTGLCIDGSRIYLRNRSAFTPPPNWRRNIS